MMQEFVAHTVPDVPAEHAEGRVWDTRVQSLMWVDQFVGLVHQATFDRSVLRLTIRRAFGVGAAVGADVFSSNSVMRMNDGKYNPDGTFRAGRMAWAKTPGASSLYPLSSWGVTTRLTDLSMRKHGSGLRSGVALQCRSRVAPSAAPTGQPFGLVIPGSAVLGRWEARAPRQLVVGHEDGQGILGCLRRAEECLEGSDQSIATGGGGVLKQVGKQITPAGGRSLEPSDQSSEVLGAGKQHSVARKQRAAGRRREMNRGVMQQQGVCATLPLVQEVPAVESCLREERVLQRLPAVGVTNPDAGDSLGEVWYRAPGDERGGERIAHWVITALGGLAQVAERGELDVEVAPVVLGALRLHDHDPVGDDRALPGLLSDDEIQVDVGVVPLCSPSERARDHNCDDVRVVLNPGYVPFDSLIVVFHAWGQPPSHALCAELGESADDLLDDDGG